MPNRGYFVCYPSNLYHSMHSFKIGEYLTIFPGARVGYNHLTSNKCEWNNCFIKNAGPKYRKLDYNKNKRAKKITHTLTICRSWYNGSYTMMAKLMKTLKLYYPIIQFLIILDIPQLELGNIWSFDMFRPITC